MTGRSVMMCAVVLITVVLCSIFCSGCRNVPVACKFSEWNEWSHCSQECGPDGTQFRVRNVIEANECTEPCSEERPCNRVCYNGGSLSQAGCDCKVEYSGQCCGCEDIDCKLSQWTEWSSCENSTSRVRSRDILRGSECAGIKCKGPYAEEQACPVVLKGNILVAKWIIITICSYAGLATVVIFTFIVSRLILRAQKTVVHVDNHVDNQTDNGDDHSQLLQSDNCERRPTMSENDDYESAYSNSSLITG